MLTELFRMDRILSVCEKICYFLAVNVLFWLSCLPVLLFCLFFGISQAAVCLPLFLLCMTSLPPAFSAVLYSMKRVQEGRERGPWKDYVKGYRTDFFQKFRLGCGQLLLIFILWTNLRFFSSQAAVPAVALISGLLLGLTVLVTPNLYLLASRYRMTNPEIVKTALTITFARPVYTLGCAASLALLLAAFEVSAGTAALFAVSVYGFLVVFLMRGVLEELEKRSAEER